jgi:DNA mismatch endonuclease (patch repair protein)
MADVFSKRKRSEVMARIRGRGNKDTELALARMLRAHKIWGWRRQMRVAVEGRRSSVEGKTRSGSRPSTFVPRLTVRPDFVFRKARTAVFVDGCFWHGCPKHGTKPKNNRAFWQKKLTANKRRDALVTRTLRRSGWRVLRLWEHELTKGEVRSQRDEPSRIVRRIQRALHQD